jgi:hypothetical protein
MTTQTTMSDMDYRTLARAAGIDGSREQLLAAGQRLAVQLGKMTPAQRAALTSAGQQPSADKGGGKRERRIALAREYGYQGTDEELAVRSRGLRRVLREMDWNADDIAQFKGMTEADKDKVIRLAVEKLDAEQAEQASTSPAATPTSTPSPSPTATPTLGLSADGSIFAATAEQLRDPEFCRRNAEHMAKLKIVEAPTPALSTPRPAPAALKPDQAGNVQITQEQLRDPHWCFRNEAVIRDVAKRVANRPHAEVAEAMKIC